MRKNLLLWSFAIVCLMAFTRCEKDDISPTESVKFQAFNEEMRELWSDHVVWTRNVIINVMDGVPGTTEAVDRLLQNQDDIGNAIKPYYGDAAGEELTGLLVAHINTAASLLTAAKNDDTNAFNTAKTAWYANADEIANFLHIANPDNFELASWKSMMKSHLDLTLEEAVARLNSDYDADVIAFDAVYAEAMMMADMLAFGIGRQFPNKF